MSQVTLDDRQNVVPPISEQPTSNPEVRAKYPNPGVCHLDRYVLTQKSLKSVLLSRIWKLTKKSPSAQLPYSLPA